MPYRIAKTLTIESGHLLAKHRGRCRFPHGHSRTVEVVLAADRLDANDMVCDFKALKAALTTLLDRWDHALCVNTTDPNYAPLKSAYGERVVDFVATDPTTEVMAQTLYAELAALLRQRAGDTSAEHPIPLGVRLERVRVTETGTSWAEYSE